MQTRLNLPYNPTTVHQALGYVYNMAECGEIDIDDLDQLRNAAEDAARLLSIDEWREIADAVVSEVLTEQGYPTLIRERVTVKHWSKGTQTFPSVQAAQGRIRYIKSCMAIPTVIVERFYTDGTSVMEEVAA